MKTMQKRTNEITNPSDYRNIGYPSSKSIIRVENSQNNGCIGYAANHTCCRSTPVINPADDLQDCDADDGNNANGYPVL